MPKAISNFQIKDAIKSLENDDIMKNFVGVFLAYHMNKFIDLKAMISEKNWEITFLIVNTDSSDKDGTHW